MKKLILLSLLLVSAMRGYADEPIREASSDLWAVIVNGGGGMAYNYERYWNDCSKMYQTLLNHGYLPEHIYVLMADGLDSTKDRTLISGDTDSSPLDLNGDLLPDIQHAATLNKLDSIFTVLANNTGIASDVFIFMTGPGVSISNNSSCLYLWGWETLKDDDFASMLYRLNDVHTINLVLGQSYSGCFIDDIDLLGMQNIVVTTACDCTQQSSAYNNLQYNDFVYHWLSAVNSITPDNTVVNGDYSQDGYVSMYEAYAYVRSHHHVRDIPHIYGSSSCLEFNVTLNAFLNSCPPDVLYADLYIADGSRDYGMEPNVNTSAPFVSTDIWIEDTQGNRVDSVNGGQTYYVRVKVRNRGESTSDGTENLYVHWNRAGLVDTWPYGWDNTAVISCNQGDLPVGGSIDPSGIALPAIGGGEEYVVSIPWSVPYEFPYRLCSSFLSGGTNAWPYSLLAYICDASNCLADSVDGSLGDRILSSNNIASTNQAVAANGDWRFSGVYVEKTDMYQLRIIINMQDQPFNENIGVYLTFDPDLLDGWQNGGSLGSGFSDLTGYGDFILTDDTIIFQDITLVAEMFYNWKLMIEFIDENLAVPTTVTLCLLDAAGNTISCQEFNYYSDIPNDSPAAAPSRKNNSAHNEPSTSISLWPNPTTDKIHIDSTDDIEEVIIYDIDGKNVLTSHQADMDLSGLSEGIYMVMVRSTSGRSFAKIIKQ